jgi:hypothetical protein
MASISPFSDRMWWTSWTKVSVLTTADRQTRKSDSNPTDLEGLWNHLRPKLEAAKCFRKISPSSDIGDWTRQLSPPISIRRARSSLAISHLYMHCGVRQTFTSYVIWSWHPEY